VRKFQILFFGYPAVILGAVLSLGASDPQSAIAGVGFMLCGTLALVSYPREQSARTVEKMSETETH
jgi:hypothetical protein